MTFSASAVFRSATTDMVTNVAALDWDTDTIKAALYGTTGTPDKDATSANSGYNAGAWVTANEITSSGQWAAGGVALASKTNTNPSSGVFMADAADTASGSTATLAAVFGCLVYDDTLTTPVADQGFCFNYFGGSNSVTSGTFTIVWNANGVFRITN
jgi:hypothetical protein